MADGIIEVSVIITLINFEECALVISRERYILQRDLKNPANQKPNYENHFPSDGHNVDFQCNESEISDVYSQRRFQFSLRYHTSE